MDPIISVIIPVYNVEPYIRQCLDSIINQTYRNLEIIVIDDGSPDGCGKICDEYAAKDDRMVVIHKENGGLSAARNDGMRRATGEWIAFVDSDDWCELDYYEHILNAACSLIPDVIFAGGHYIDYPEKHQDVCTINASYYCSEHICIENLQADLLRYGMPWDKLYRTSFLKKHKFRFATEIRAFEDFLFNFQVFEKAQSVYLCVAPGYHYRQTNSSIAHGFNPNKPDIVYAFIAKLHEQAREYGVSQKVENGINAVTVCAIAIAMNNCYFHSSNSKSSNVIDREVEEMLNRPYCYAAIHSPSNNYLSPRQIVLKYAMRIHRGGNFGYSLWQEKYCNHKCCANRTASIVLCVSSR